MFNLYNRIHEWKTALGLPEKSKINTAILSFSKKERCVFSVLVLVLILSTLLILNSVNKHFMVSVPTYGGSISEGIIGNPRFINPILANSPADQDLVTLIYSGLMRKTPEGNLIPDLAEKYEVSEDGLIYTFTLKDNIYFHDGEPVTVDDIVFTIDTVKDSIIKSPYRANWEGVNVSKIDEKTVEFTLKQPYASFLENTTFGIMPAHLWGDSPVELNTANAEPIGSGPYMFSSISKQSSGVVDKYELKSFKKFALGRPYIENITLRFYLNEGDLVKALEDGEVKQISSITPTNAEILKNNGFKIESSVLPRVFGLFFNQNINGLFVDKTIISAIDQAIDKDRIINEVLAGYGTAISGPIPPNMIQYQALNSKDKQSRPEILEKIQKNLASNGWVKNSEGFLEKTTTSTKTTTKSKAKAKASVIKTKTLLEFSISTSDVSELSKTALIIKENLAEIGIKVNIQTFDTNSLNQDVIRPRKYDALLFGQVINNESDLFAFWHSSQIKDPGLNIAMYANSKVDKILEDAFTTINQDARVKKYIQFENEIKKDLPAVFLYTPNFVYVVSKDLNGLSIDHLTFPSDRFLGAHMWYIENYNVWKIFAR